jgi:hypothetical protein
METQAEHDWWELGRADGMALGLLTILNHRGILISPRIHDRINACRDTDRIQGWVGAAAKARTIYDIFPDPAGRPRSRRPRTVRTSGWLLAGHDGAARSRWATLKRRLDLERRPEPLPWPGGASFPGR